MRLIIVLLMFLIGLALAKTSSSLSLNCQVATACSNATIFKISSTTNAHAEVPSSTNYAYGVCCQGSGFAVGNSCSTGISVLKLSAATNAHVQIPSVNTYANDVCLSSPPAVLISCAYTTQDCISAGYDTCVATIPANTNAHVADCTTDPYQTKICCKAQCSVSTETNCADGVDNDCDGATDCADSDCAGSITGTVKNQQDQPVLSADVSAKKDLTTINSATTGQQGTYSINSINCGTYNLIASHPDYAPQTQILTLAPKQQFTKNFSLVLGTSCEPDCTFAADYIIHASCDGKNGCAFYNSISKAACDNSQPGWLRDYNETHYVTCASGVPQPKVEIQASVNCASGTIVKVTRIVVYNGKPVKLVVATCG